MSKIRRVEEIVKKILEEVEETRDDDFKLYLLTYVSSIPEAAVFDSFFDVLSNSKEYELIPFETATRCRRKLQRQFENLRGSKYEDRLNRQKDFIEYDLDLDIRIEDL